MDLSQRARRIQPSATIAVTAKAAELRSQGIDVISLGAGEPDFDTPEHIKQAAIEAIGRGETKYTAVGGTEALKQAVVEKYRRDNDLQVSSAEVLVSCGAKHSIFNVLLSLIEQGDEVLVPAPYWVSYTDMSALVEGTPVVLPTGSDQQFKLSAEQLDDAVTAKTRLLILNSPSNPTGQTYSAAELSAIGEVVRRHPRLMVLCDDIYEPIYWGQEPLQTLINVCPDLRQRTVLINGVSKAYAMTGWRIGYTVAPEALIAAMRKIQGQSTTNPCSISQAAAQAALLGDQQCVRDMCAAYHQRHDYITAALDKLPGVQCLSGNGAFYAFPDFSTVMRERGFEDDVQLAADILEQARVALVPGTAFGAPGYLRASYATSMQQLQAAVERLQRYLSR